ncbi:MAG: glycosyltransferase family 39 protein [Methyloceanibacter sp.]
MQAIQAARRIDPRHWCERHWREQDYWVWLLVFLAVLLAVRLLALVLDRTDLFFDEAQYWTWSRDLAFGYFSKPPLIAWIIRLATDVCGDAEWCLRAPSPILYTLTSIFVFLAGRALYDDHFWSAVVFATLPAASFSSLLISTDVPLLDAGALWLDQARAEPTHGLRALARHKPRAWPSRQICRDLFSALRGDRRMEQQTGKGGALRGGRAIVALAIAFALIAPNLVWNAEHSFATFSHTAENAGWKEAIHLGAALEFLGSQFAVFGPIRC